MSSQPINGALILQQTTVNAYKMCFQSDAVFSTNQRCSTLTN